MDITQIVGVIIVILAYLLVWFVAMKSKNIVEEINKKGLSKLREIQEEIKL